MNVGVPATLTFRPAVRGEAPSITALVTSAYRGEDSRGGWTTEADLLSGERIDVEQVTATIDNAASDVLLAYAPDGELIACCEVAHRGGDRAYFGMFAVRPTAQAGGIGRQVLAEAERYAQDRWGAAVMEMTVIAQRTELIDWYVRRGYRRTDETRPFPYGDTRFGVPRRDDLHFSVLTKKLTPPA
jgi:ribosomal protein S18 acetylase RimI-like enzyme